MLYICGDFASLTLIYPRMWYPVAWPLTNPIVVMNSSWYLSTMYVLGCKHALILYLVTAPWYHGIMLAHKTNNLEKNHIPTKTWVKIASQLENPCPPLKAAKPTIGQDHRAPTLCLRRLRLLLCLVSTPWHCGVILATRNSGGYSPPPCSISCRRLEAIIYNGFCLHNAQNAIIQ